MPVAQADIDTKLEDVLVRFKPFLRVMEMRRLAHESSCGPCRAVDSEAMEKRFNNLLTRVQDMVLDENLTPKQKMALDEDNQNTNQLVPSSIDLLLLDQAYRTWLDVYSMTIHVLTDPEEKAKSDKLLEELRSSASKTMGNSPGRGKHKDYFQRNSGHTPIRVIGSSRQDCSRYGFSDQRGHWGRQECQWRRLWRGLFLERRDPNIAG
jgi:hypothetical protein